MAALGALDAVRRQLLSRGRDSDVNELRLAGTLCGVSPHLADRTRQRCSALLEGVDPTTLDNPTGLAAVWEVGIKVAISSNTHAWNHFRGQPLSQWQAVTVLRTGSLKINISGTSNIDGRVKLLAARATLLELILRMTDVSLAGTRALAAGGGCLHTLDLSDSFHMTDAVLEPLSACSALKTLTLDNCTEVTDQGFEAVLTMLPILENLSLQGCQLTDLPEVGYLFIEGYGFTSDYGTKMTKYLRSLNLVNCTSISAPYLEQIVRDQGYLRKVSISPIHNTQPLRDFVQRRYGRRNIVTVVEDYADY